MTDTDEKVEGWKELKELIDARTVEEDMETRNNMNWLNNRVVELETEVKRLREIIQVQIVTPRSKDFFFQHYGKDDFEERWKEWVDGIQDRVWGRKND